MDTPNTRLNDPISGDRGEQLASDLQHHKSRIVIKEVVEEYIGSSKFAERVEDIQLKSLEADPARNKLKGWVVGVIQTHLTEQGLKRRNFMWPLAISILSAIGTIAAAIIASVALHK